MSRSHEAYMVVDVCTHAMRSRPPPACWIPWLMLDSCWWAPAWVLHAAPVPDMHILSVRNAFVGMHGMGSARAHARGGGGAGRCACMECRSLFCSLS